MSHVIASSIPKLVKISKHTSFITHTHSRVRTLAANSNSINAEFAMPRYPTLSSPPGTLRLFDHIGTMAFAASGAALAGTSGLDAYGCVTIGMITALGGGTLRDVVILARRPFWILESEYLVTAAAASLLAFTFWPHKGPEEEGIVQIEMKKIPPSSTISKDWSPWPSAENPFATADFGSSLPMQALDTLGLAAFCVIGAQNGCAAGVGLLPSIICGTLTATGGGMVRDVFCGQPVRVLHNHAEIYATTAMCGGK